MSGIGKSKARDFNLKYNYTLIFLYEFNIKNAYVKTVHKKTQTFLD